MSLRFCRHDASVGADGESRARAAAGALPRRGGARPSELHQDGDPEGGARAAAEQEHVGAEPGPDGECVWRHDRYHYVCVRVAF